MVSQSYTVCLVGLTRGYVWIFTLRCQDLQVQKTTSVGRDVEQDEASLAVAAGNTEDVV